MLGPGAIPQCYGGTRAVSVFNDLAIFTDDCVVGVASP